MLEFYAFSTALELTINVVYYANMVTGFSK